MEVTNVDINTNAINDFNTKVKELQLKASGIIKDITKFKLANFIL